MKFRFTIRGLFLLTTFVAILVTIGLWFSQWPLFWVVFLYLFLYIGVFSVLYVFRYRRQFHQARATWNEHKLARAALHESIAIQTASHTQRSRDQSRAETSQTHPGQA